LSPATKCIDSNAPAARRITFEVIDFLSSRLDDATRGVAVNMLVALMAWHDDDHREQLTRAVEGKP
jgi:hypothetical protein